LNLAFGSNFKRVLKRVETAFKTLHKKGKYKAEDIGEVQEYKDLIDETAGLLSSAIKDNDIPDDMLKNLKQDVFLFSGLKTHAQLLEASKLLLTDEGTIKSFSKFSEDVKSIKSNYNETYLEAEYNFAVSSAQMAGQWAEVSNDYDLNYRTAKDDKVRASHKEMDETTLPPDDAFWKSYYPPNGWRCRCNAVRVRKGKYETSDPEAAIKSGEKATTQLGKDGKNKLEIFRFNPGQQQVIFPPKHPYRKVQGAKVVKDKLK
jgi:SPP1 gp7 family putative phage head morphogenesis protein